MTFLYCGNLCSFIKHQGLALGLAVGLTPLLSYPAHALIIHVFQHEGKVCQAQEKELEEAY